MEHPILKLKDNKLVWKYFYELSQIPRVREFVRINKYLKQVLTELNIKFSEDKAGNIIGYVPATKGYEKYPTISLQAHTDMVGAKTNESKHDFTKDPIELIIEGDWIKANNTTLGGDDGIGVAIILAIIADRSCYHGPLEVIFTSLEECGLMGVEKLDTKKIKARYMINLDTSNEKSVIVGCNGGRALKCYCNVKREAHVRAKSKNYTISMVNAIGGHSGADISKHRLNTITQIFGILASLIAMYDVRLVEIPTVGVYNAIPANFCCTINVLDKDIKEVKRIVNEDFTITKQHYTTHSKLACDFAIAKTTLKPLVANDNKKIIQAVTIFPNGALNYRSDLGISDVSSNVGFIELKQNSFSTEMMVRSMFINKIKYLSQRIVDIANVFGLKHEMLSENNAWMPKHDNNLAELYAKCAKEILHYKPTIAVTAGGLETGIFASKIPNLKCIAIGPCNPNIHTYDEKLSIKSTNKITEIIKNVLSSLDK